MLNFLKREAKQGKLIIGICLGAQLLTESSCEYGYTSGLGIVPGKIIPFSDGKCHIGWNELNNYRSTYDINYKDSYYFNHSLYYQGPDEYVLCKSFFNSSFASVYKKQNVIGLQFHPEKSQISGRIFLKEIINSFFYA